MENERNGFGFIPGTGDRKETHYDCYLGKTVTVDCGNVGATGVLKNVFNSFGGWVFHFRPYNAHDPETSRWSIAERDKVLDVPSGVPHSITEFPGDLALLVDKLNRKQEAEKQEAEMVRRAMEGGKESEGVKGAD